MRLQVFTKDLDNPYQDHRNRDYGRKLLEILIELQFAMVVVSVGVLLGALLKTTVALFASSMIRSSKHIALHNQEL